MGIGSNTGIDNLFRYAPFSPVLGANGMLTTTLAQVWLNPQSRQAVYFSVRGYDQTGLYTTTSSGPVFIVSPENTLPDWIHDGPSPGSDIDYQNTTNYTSAYFHFGVNCPIQEYRWAVESADGMMVQGYITTSLNLQTSSLLPTLVDNTFPVSTDQIQLYNGETYRVLVQATDLTGRVHVLRSNGSAVTTRGLGTGIVRDGLVDGFELNFQVSLATLSAYWSGFGDGSPEQAVAYYEVAVGSGREFPNTRTNVVPLTGVGSVQRYTFAGLRLVAMGMYYVTVRAHAVSGSWVDATSDGVTVGVSSAIIPGEVVLPPYQSDLSSVTAYWSQFEGSLPVQSYQWALGTRPLSSQELGLLCADIKSNYTSRFEVLRLVDVGTDTVGTATGLSLKHNTTYYATVRAVDQAGQCIAASSNPLLVDTTPPSIQAVTVGPSESSWNSAPGQDHLIYVQPGVNLYASWNGFPDPESGVSGYEVGLVTRSACSSVLVTSVALGYAGVGQSLSFTFEGPALTPGVAYSVAVRATNRANLTSVAFSEPILVDGSALLPGTVMDGLSWQGDAVYQSGLGTLSASLAHSLLGLQSGACNDLVTIAPLDGVKLVPPALVGVAAQSTVYRLGQVTDNPGMGLVNISATLDPTGQFLLSGAYQIPVAITNRSTVTLDVQAASGDPSLQPYVVTSLVFMDSPSVVLAEFDKDGSLPRDQSFAAVGLQIHHSRTALGRQFYPQSVLLWSYNGDPLSAPLQVTKNISLDLSVPHEYSLGFYSRQLDTGITRSVEVRIDDQLVAVLYDVTALSGATRLVVHVFTKDEPIPLSSSVIATPVVAAVFSNIAVTTRPAGVCGYGVPFYSSGSPIVAFRAAAGTKPGDSSVSGWQVSMEVLTHICIEISKHSKSVTL